jgi:hypothetical protein
MSNANRTDRMRQLQLRALAENLYLLANHHREHGNYIVAHALYGRALATAHGAIAQEHKENGSALVTRIRKRSANCFRIVALGHNWFGGPSDRKSIES